MLPKQKVMTHTYLKIYEEQKKTYSTWTSRVVPHRTTIQARTCLTSQIRRDAVLSRLYGRRYEVDKLYLHQVTSNYVKNILSGTCL